MTAHAPDADGPAPLALEDLQLGNEIGSGSTGTVYRARTRRSIPDLPAGSPVAVKFLRRSLLDDPAAVARLRQEGEIGMRIVHPNVARIYAVVEAELMGLPLTGLVMELIEGPTLRRFLLESGPAVEDLCRRAGRDVALGLAALHGHGIVHRDVKPENLALTPSGRVKLMDLGLAWIGQPLVDEAAGEIRSSSGGFFGSLAYAAPEVLRGRSPTPKTDLYGLGVVLFELATGEHPFADVVGRPDELMHAHLHRAPQPVSARQPRVSPTLEALIAELLHKEPILRLGDAERVAALLAEGERAAGELTERRNPNERRLRATRRFAPTRLYGRDRELRRLQRLAEQVVRRGHGNAVRVTGPEGIGRRRLLDEWLQGEVSSRGDEVELLVGVPDPSPTRQLGSPFPALVVDLLTGGDPTGQLTVDGLRAQRVPEADAEDLLAALELRGVRGSPERRAALLADALLPPAPTPPRHLRILRIDRADQLDTTGQLVLARLLEQMVDRPLMVVLVMHARQAATPFEHERLELAGLDLNTFTTFAGALFGPGHTPPAGRFPAAWSALGGNPGALMDALDAAALRGELEGVPGSFRSNDAELHIRPADPLLHRVRRRVSELPAPQRFVLQAAALLGDRSPLADLVALVGQPELQVLAALSLFQGRIVGVDAGEVQFRHRDFRTALLDTVPLATRRRLHRQAAFVLEKRGATPLSIGIHYSRAMEHEAAFGPLVDGLEQLVAAGSRQAARRVLRRLRLHAATLPDDERRRRQRLRFHLLAAAAAEQRADHTALVEAARAALRLARDLAAGDERARAFLYLARASTRRGQLLAASGLLDSAAACDVEPTTRGAIEVHRAEVRLTTGDLDGASTALTAARRVDGLPARVRARLALARGRLHARRLQFASTLRQLDRAAALFREADDGDGAVETRLLAGRVRAVLGDRERAATGLADATAAASERRRADLAASGELYLGEQAAWYGDHGSARTHLLAACAHAAESGQQVVLATAVVWLRVLGFPMPRPALRGAADSSLELRALLAIVADEIDVDTLGELGREPALPIHLRLAAYWRCGDERSAVRMVHAMRARLPATMSRRAFHTLTERRYGLVADAPV